MRYFPHVVFVALLVLAMYVSTQAEIVSFLEMHMQGSVLGGAFFVLALVLAVVLAPLAALPLIPIASSLFGPFLAGIYSVIGWTIGGTLAFLAARYAGRPLLAKLVSLNDLARYERLVPSEMAFVTLVLLRMVVPVDALSYAVGFLSMMPLRTYALATLIGVTPFSFIFAYGSNAVATKNHILIGALVLLGISIFATVYMVLRRLRRIPKGG